MNRIFVIMLAFIVLFLISCQEDPSPLGADLLPDSDKMEILYDTTFTFNSYVYQNEPFITSNYSKYNLGLIDESYFGKFEGKFAGQFLPIALDTNIIYYSMDSIILYLHVDSIYGKPNESVKLNVYELNTDILEDSSYYSNFEINDIYTETNRINTDYYLRGDSLIVLPIATAFGYRLQDDKEDYRSDSTFKLRFKGLSIVPELIANPGGTYYTDFSSSNTKLVFYYHYNNSDSLVANYYFYRGDRFAQYSFDYSSSTLNDYLTNPSDESDDLMFIQGLNGVSSKIELTNYKSWLTSNSYYSVLNAELSIPVLKDDNFDSFIPPQGVYFTFAKEDSSMYAVEDYGLGNFGGVYDSDKSEYRFNISKHFMNMVNGNIEDSCLNLNISSTYAYPHRAILKSGDNIKLKVIYTKH